MAITLGIAGINVELPNPTSFQKQAEIQYPGNNALPADMVITVSDEEIAAENTHGETHEKDYLRDVCTYRNICERLDEFDAFVLHGASVCIDDEAYVFCARSGTGKSTHISLLRHVYQGRVKIINGDKPIIRFFDGKAYVCGTPWAGKENWQRNVRYPLKALCFVEQSPTNEITRLEKKEAVDRLMCQVLRSHEALRLARQLKLMDAMLAQADTWRLKCNISDEAARLSFTTMTGIKETHCL